MSNRLKARPRTKRTIVCVRYIERADDQTLEPEVEFSIPWKIKWTSLAAVMLLPLGVNWASASLGPLKNTLRKEMKINNEQFGVISSADAVVNSYVLTLTELTSDCGPFWEESFSIGSESKPLHHFVLAPS